MAPFQNSSECCLDMKALAWSIAITIMISPRSASTAANRELVFKLAPELFAIHQIFAKEIGIDIQAQAGTGGHLQHAFADVRRASGSHSFDVVVRTAQRALRAVEVLN